MLSRVAGRTSCSRMPVICVILNGCFSMRLVDTGLEWILVSHQVLESHSLRPGKAVLTADDKASQVKGQC